MSKKAAVIVVFALVGTGLGFFAGYWLLGLGLGALVGAIVSDA